MYINILKLAILVIAVVAFVGIFEFKTPVQSQSRPESDVDRVRRERFRHNGIMYGEAPAGKFEMVRSADNKARHVASPTATEAPTGFDSLTNGFLVQGPPYATINSTTVVPLASFNDDRFLYEDVETIEDGLGPTYNAQSCRECHQNVVTGGASQVTVMRSGRTINGQFFDSLGGSLIQSRATNPKIIEQIADSDTTRTFRITPATLGDGYIEAIANNTLLAIRDAQPVEVRGYAVMTPVFEGDGSARVGRFGWKAQHASLLSFSNDAYLNEMGITTPTLPAENTANGLFVGYGTEYDPVLDPENDGTDTKAFADFMRATKAPTRGDIGTSEIFGERVFNQVGCNVCHIPSITTSPVGSVINGGVFTIPAALGDKIIHPYSDLLLHDIGTGDGIPLLNTPEYAITATQIKTPPLWGLRTRNRLMHDGLTFTLNDAILRHAGQAAASTNAYSRLLGRQKSQLIAFLRSL